MTDTVENPRVTILAISSKQNTADTVENLLRGAGHNVHVDWLEDPRDLAGRLEKGEPGLICCRPDDGDTACDRLLDFCLNTARDTPVVLLADSRRRAVLMRAGARDVVDPDDNEHLAQVLDREFRTVTRIGELARTRERLAQMEARLDDILAKSQDPRATIHEGIHAQINAVYARLFGFDDPEELVGVPLMDLVAPEDRDRVKRQLASCLKSGIDPEPIDCLAQRADDSRIRLSIHLRSIAVDGETHVEVLIPRETPAHDEENLAGGFTGRASLYQALEQHDGTRGLRGLLYVCIDDLDSLQKRLGLPGADQVLNEVSAFLLERTDAGDQSFRLNVSEFALMVERNSEVELEATAESLRLAIDGEVFGDEAVSAPLAASIAIVPLGERENEQRLLQAMHLARKLSQRGGNKAAMVADNRRMDAPREGDRQWVGRLQQALEHDGFALAYQAIASLEGDQKRYFDVLLRLVDDNRFIQPEEFFDIAERHGLMPMIDQWVTAQVLDLQGDQGKTPMFVTLSGSTIDCGEAFVAWLDQRAGRSGDCSTTLFVLSEQGIQCNVKRAQVLAEKLKAMGFGLAIGHYGATSKSTQLLDRLPADFVKLDGSFTESLGNDEDSPRLGELLQAAREKKLKVIAERVEDANSMARLWQLGVSYVQSRSIQEPNEGGRKSDANVA